MLLYSLSVKIVSAMTTHRGLDYIIENKEFTDKFATGRAFDITAISSVA